jgi:TolB-like protein/Flp pilus assembly protein TadD
MPARFQEVRSRKLVQWGLGYLAVAWAVVQVIDLIADRFDWPPVLVRGLIVVAAFGFLVALTLAWFHGERGRQHIGTGEAVLLGLIGIVTFGALAQLPTPEPESARGPAPELAGIAILPLENLSARPDSVGYIAEGLHDELVTHLAKIRSLRVIGRSSVLEYTARAPGTLQRVRDELRVRHVLEGTVRLDGRRMRVGIRLVDVLTATATPLGDFDGSLDDILRIQREIASAVTLALQAEVTPTEQQRLAIVPTSNIEAYKYYLRGAAVKFAGYGEEDIGLSVQMYQTAVRLDSGFATAYARLAVAHANYSWFISRTPSRIAAALAALDRATALAPTDPETCLAAAVIEYRVARDYAAAQDALACALDGMPGDARAHHLRAAIARRAGNWNAAVAGFARTFELEPRSAANAMELGVTFWLLRRYREADRYLAHATALDPQFTIPWFQLAMVRLAETGAVGAARTLEDAERAGVVTGDSDLLLYGSVLLQLYQQRYDAAMQLLDLEDPGVLEFQWFHVPAHLLKAQLNLLIGDAERARAELEIATLTLELRKRESPEDPLVWSSLGLAYALAGRSHEARNAAEHAVELLPIETDAWVGAYLREYLGYVYAVVGDFERATDEFAFLLSRPAPLSRTQLRVDPRLSALRGHRRFAELLRDQTGS